MQAVLRFTRADGSAVFGPVGRAPVRFKQLEVLASRLGDPSLSGVLARWRPARTTSPPTPSSPPPLAYSLRTDRPLAILRNDWDARGDILAIDHRQAVERSYLEVGARGQTWLGPSWSSGRSGETVSEVRPSFATLGTSTMAVEWSFLAGSQKITRLTALFRGQSMALLGQQCEGVGSSSTNEVRLSLAEGVEAMFVPGSRALTLSPGRGKAACRLIPLGLPDHDRATGRGSIAVEGREVVVRQSIVGNRNWLPILLCWGAPPTSWKPLTVAFQSTIVGEDEAFASRVAWGRLDDALILYQSLGLPELRCFLGHQTRSRLLVATFDRLGDVRPLFKMDTPAR